MVQEKHNILLRHFLSDCTQLFEDLIALDFDENK